MRAWRHSCRKLIQPAVCEEAETHYLDLGSGEIGYYLYRILEGPDSPGGGMECSAGAKEEWSGISDLLKAGGKDVGRLREQRAQITSYLLREMEQAAAREVSAASDLSPHKDPPKLSKSTIRGTQTLPLAQEKPTLLIGITGDLAVTVAKDEEVAALMEEFVLQLEEDLRSASGKQWELHYFLLPKQSEAFYERIAVCWLIENSDLKLTDTFAKEPKLYEYIRQQMTSWALLSGKKNIGELEQDEFIEKLMPLSRQPTFERRAWEALEWFRLMDEDKSGTVTISEMLNYMLGNEELLRAVIRHRLFVGTLAGGTSSVQLTVVDPNPEADDEEVELHMAHMGNRSPVPLGVFPQDQWVTRPALIQWESMLVGTFDGESLLVPQVPKTPSSSRPLAGIRRFDVGEAFRRPQLRKQDTASSSASHSIFTRSSGEWPSGLRGIFICISSMFYAAKECGIHERLIRKQHALSALSSAIEDALKEGSDQPPGSADPKTLQFHQQKVANLSMAHSMVSRVLHDDAWLYFRRTWQTPTSSFVATWSLGVFLSGKRRDGKQATTGSFTRVRSRLDKASSSGDTWDAEQHKSGHWTRRLAAAVRFQRLGQRKGDIQHMD
ncbi:unnamed protein product [Polarella glacialis]|uniref:EF-hand domain-containing protein n=1 Tax=Polarella glacialis TaxID=89957 RepID=A0A813JK81_POLGL|nr:unnamed protein product [Polarella glacialis]